MLDHVCQTMPTIHAVCMLISGASVTRIRQVRQGGALLRFPSLATFYPLQSRVFEYIICCKRWMADRPPLLLPATVLQIDQQYGGCPRSWLAPFLRLAGS